MNDKELYDKARQALKAKDYATARKAIDRLSKSKNAKARQAAASLAKHLPARKKSRTPLLITGAIIALIAVGVGIWAQRKLERFAFIDAYRGACIDAYADSAGISAFTENFNAVFDTCHNDAEDEYYGRGFYRTEIKYCMKQTQGGRLEEQFARCLDANGVNPYPILPR